MKKILSVILAMILIFNVFSIVSFSVESTENIADFVLPKPQTPNYMMFYDEDTDDNMYNSDELKIIAMLDQSVISLSKEYYADSEAFYEKYGLYSFVLVIQFDSSLDDTRSWKYTSEWDTYYGAPGTGSAAGIIWLDEEIYEPITLFSLYNCDYGEYEDLMPAVAKKEHFDGSYDINTYHFNESSHSLNIRCRYYLEWQMYDGETIGETQSKFSEWSDIAVFGRNSTAVTPSEPTVYEAPSISNLTYFPSKGNDIAYFEYIQTTPESVWVAGIYYEMTSDGYFEGLETQISVNNGEWQEYDTYDSGGDWCLLNGKRMCGNEDVVIEEGDNIKLRIRFTGTHGPSAWSEIAEITAEGVHEHTLAHTAAKAPTCCAMGNIEYWHCASCGKFFSDEEALTEVDELSIPATDNHTFNGWTTNEERHWHQCTVGATVVDSALHTPGPEATETTPQTCTVCGYVIKKALGDVTGVTISGKITTFYDGINSDSQTYIGLFRQGETSLVEIITLTGSGEQTYSFNNVEEGIYTIIAIKDNHARREYSINVRSVNIKANLQINLIGDIDGDGSVRMNDMSRVNAHVKETTLLTGYALKCADVTDDGNVRMNDLSRINAHVKETSYLWKAAI